MRRLRILAIILVATAAWAAEKEVYRDTHESTEDRLERLRKEREDLLRRRIPELRREALREDEEVRGRHEQIVSQVQYWSNQVSTLRPTDSAKTRAKALAQLSHWKREQANLWNEATPELTKALKRVKQIDREMSDLRSGAPSSSRKSRRDRTTPMRGRRRR